MANLLSGLRLALALPFALLMLRASPLSSVLFCIAISTDLLDGLVARRTRGETPLGRVLDHVADVTFVEAGLLAAAQRGLVPIVLPIVVGFAFAQYVIDSRFQLLRTGLRMNSLGRTNGILYFFPLGGVLLVDLGMGWLVAPIGWLAWALVLSTAASMLDRLAALRG
jgi:phosphatidylglycerophosphate synthase